MVERGRVASSSEKVGSGLGGGAIGLRNEGSRARKLVGGDTIFVNVGGMWKEEEKRFLARSECRQIGSSF